MSRVLAAVAECALRDPKRLALYGISEQVSYARLQAVVTTLAAELRHRKIRTAALIADNSPAWVLMDLATIAAQIRLVPLPPYFSRQQLWNALRSTQADALITDTGLNLAATLGLQGRTDLQYLAPELTLELFELNLPRASGPAQPAGTQKITFTSGTTGQSKGICLSQSAMEMVAESLAAASTATALDHHLCALPLSTLLENIGGVYAPLLSGASCRVLPMHTVGLNGATQIDGDSLARSLRRSRASSAILVPQMLRALIEAIELNPIVLPQLRYLAIGGAPVSRNLLRRARAVGLPVHEGYGLSECASVVALNTSTELREGSVGKPLPHVRLRIAEDGEILVKTTAFLAYTGEAPQSEEQWLATGDLGYLDQDGYLYLNGRKKSMFVTAFGRNVAPEWIERELCDDPAIAQSAVFGEGRASNTAVVVSSAPPQRIEAAIQGVNKHLPDYARVSHWLYASEPFSPQNQQMTANGRPRHAEILQCYGAAIDALYEEPLCT